MFSPVSFCPPFTYGIDKRILVSKIYLWFISLFDICFIFKWILTKKIVCFFVVVVEVSSFFALATYSCLSMKLFSYLQVNKALRDKQKQSLFASSPPSSPTTTSTTTTASSSAASSPSTPINNNNNNIVNFQLSRSEKLAQKSSSTTSSSNGPTTTNGKPKAKVDYPNNLTKYG